MGRENLGESGTGEKVFHGLNPPFSAVEPTFISVSAISDEAP
jgi:hypothetical protein